MKRKTGFWIAFTLILLVMLALLELSKNTLMGFLLAALAAALFALRDGPRLRKRAWWQAASVLLALCISLSTVFMKQHSILDVLCALPVCALGWWLCYGRPGRHG